jgi:hypothetical protein
MLMLLASGACVGQPREATEPQPASAPVASALPLVFTVPDAQLHSPLSFILYGDMRFTDPKETEATAPGPRRALVAKVAAEPVDALFLTGDIPWHGGDFNDYREYEVETAIWREHHLRVYPILGNHEFTKCEEAACLANWWQAFPPLRGHRWYAVALGRQLRVLALDSTASLRPGSEQRAWLEQELQSLPREVRFVILALHHPPIADQALLVVRPNERALGTYLEQMAPRSAARFVVCAAHVHNYERFERGGVVYLISGGGGAKPHPVGREEADRYQDTGFPNYHFLRFKLQGDRLSAEMTRLEDFDASDPHTWAVKDRFEVLAKVP